MKIQSIIRRANGTTVELGDEVYFFSPSNDHTCDVDDDDHVDRLLSIKEGFRPAPVQDEKAESSSGTGDNSQAESEQSKDVTTLEKPATVKRQGGRKKKAESSSGTGE